MLDFDTTDRLIDQNIIYITLTEPNIPRQHNAF